MPFDSILVSRILSAPPLWVVLYPVQAVAAIAPSALVEVAGQAVGASVLLCRHNLLELKRQDLLL